MLVIISLTSVNVLILTLLLWLLCTPFVPSEGGEADVSCLKSIKQSLQDPYRHLRTWRLFNETTEGFICEFSGVDCWQGKNIVYNIKLSGMRLRGRFPLGLANCTSLAGLDLSGNQLSGAIPPNISRIVPFVTSIDLSSNNFSGEIPLDIVKCSFLNIVKLDNNRLVGSIPWQIGLMPRLRNFSVANNQLSGPVPTFNFPTVTAESFANNKGLCGWPLEPCVQLTTTIKTSDHSFKSGFVFGFVTGVVPVTVAIISCCTPCVQGRRKDEMVTVAAVIVLIFKRWKFVTREN